MCTGAVCRSRQQRAAVHSLRQQYTHLTLVSCTFVEFLQHAIARPVPKKLCLFIVSGCFCWQEDDDARAVVLESLLRDGMDIKFNLKFIRVQHEEPEEEGDFPIVRVVVEQNGEEQVSRFGLAPKLQAVS